MTFRDHYKKEDVPHFHNWYERQTDIKHRHQPLIFEGARIATIGSCFASEIAMALNRLGLNGELNPTGLVYNTSCIRQELAQAFGEFDGYELEPYWETSGGFISPFHHPKEVHPTSDALIEWYAGKRKQASRLFRSADIIIITLGLIEAWYQPKTGNWYRYIPYYEVFENVCPDFHRLTVTEMIRDLSVIKDLINRHTKSKIILTVSPIPLHMTFTSMDIRVANAESKSRIRAAVSEFLDENPDIFYFHSYEIVMTAERMSDFMLADGRHVSRRGIEYILATFMQQFAQDNISTQSIDSSWITPHLPTPRTFSNKNSNEVVSVAQKIRKWFVYAMKKLFG